MTHRLVYIKITITILIWSLTPIVGKIALQSMSPLQLNTYRFGIATLALLPFIVFAKRTISHSFRQHLIFAGLGFLGAFFYQYLFYQGIAHTLSTHVVIIVCLSPVVIYVGAILFLKEKFTFLVLPGLVISLSGIMYLTTHGHLNTLFNGGVNLGDRYLLIAVCVWAAYTILFKKYIAHINNMDAVFFISLYGVLYSMGAYFVGEQKTIGQLFAVPLSGWLCSLYYGLLASVLAYIWYNESVRVIGPFKTSAFQNLNPVFGNIAIVLISPEPFSVPLLVGTVLVLIGLNLVIGTEMIKSTVLRIYKKQAV